MAITDNFDQGVKYEKSWQATADALYKKLGFTDIRRFDFDAGGVNKSLQLKDIDLELKGRTTITVSEKFRSRDFGDIMLEIVQSYGTDKEKDGWALISEADYLFQMTPKSLYIIKESVVKKIAEKIKEQLKNVNIPAQPTPKPIKFNGVDGLVFVGNNSRGSRTWLNLGVCVPLREFGIQAKRVVDGIKIFY